VIGRDGAADVAVEDPKLSRRHAAFRVIDGHPYVEDLGSINGVKLRGRRVDARCRLRDGDRLRLGGTLLRVHARDLPPPTTSLGPRILGPDLELPLSQPIRVGRGADCQLRSDDPSISPLHARIDPDPPMVHDLGSARGVYVNDLRVRWSELRDGDELRFGRLGFEVEIPMGPEGPRGFGVWRSPWPRRAGLAALSFGVLGLVVALASASGPPDGGDPPPRAPGAGPPEDPKAPARATAPDQALPPSPLQLAPSKAPRPDKERPKRSSPLGPGRGSSGRTFTASKRSFDAPRSWTPSLERYFAGEIAQARRRARDPELVSWLQEAEARHARALTEVSNDLERAKVLLAALARTEAKVHDRPSPMRRDLQVLLASAFAERGERSLEQARGDEAHRQLEEARALAPGHPRVEALARRVQASAQSEARRAEAWARSGDRRACRAWRRVEAMTAADSTLGRRARRAAGRSCAD